MGAGFAHLVVGTSIMISVLPANLVRDHAIFRPTGFPDDRFNARFAARGTQTTGKY
jgi:hypothetical protein